MNRRQRKKHWRQEPKGSGVMCDKHPAVEMLLWPRYLRRRAFRRRCDSCRMEAVLKLVELNKEA